MTRIPTLVLAAFALAWTSPVDADLANAPVPAPGDLRRPASTDVPLTIEIRDLSRVPPAVMRETRAEIGRTFLASGVRIAWVGQADSPRDPTTLRVFVVGGQATASHRGEEPDSTLVGLAPQRGNWVQVFYGRVAAAVARRPLSIGVVLAHVISHELGHLLLPPDSHAPYGIMRHAVELEHPSLRRFTVEQSRLIRTALASGQRYASRCRH
jgi:hypothetical protein